MSIFPSVNVPVLYGGRSIAKNVDCGSADVLSRLVAKVMVALDNYEEACLQGGTLTTEVQIAEAVVPQDPRRLVRQALGDLMCCLTVGMSHGCDITIAIEELHYRLEDILMVHPGWQSKYSRANIDALLRSIAILGGILMAHQCSHERTYTPLIHWLSDLDQLFSTSQIHYS